jgi:Tfp pilus assembly protein PilV
MTLVEALITCALLIVALVLTAVLFNYSNRTTEASKERSDALGERTGFSERLRKALSNSHRSGNTYLYLTSSDLDPDLAVSLITTKDANGEKGWNTATQRPIYQGYRIFYRDSTDNTIRYLHHAVTPTEVAQPLEEAELRTAIASGTSRILVREATELCLYSLEDGSISPTESNPLGLRWRVGLERGNSILTEFSFKFVNL